MDEDVDLFTVRTETNRLFRGFDSKNTLYLSEVQ